MSRYLETAAKANPAIKSLYNQYKERNPSDEDLALFLEQIMRVFNLGMRSNPRPANGTVRVKACTAAAKGLPVKFSIKSVPIVPPRGRFTSFNALQITSTSLISRNTVVDDNADLED